MTRKPTRRSKTRARRKRRQAHGSAWHWRQTDAWYYTRPGTRKRVPLFDDNGERIRGKDNKESAQLALARVKLAGGWETAEPAISNEQWVVARAASEYIQHCERGVANGTITENHLRQARGWLNDLCAYCGALPLQGLKKGHVKNWLESHATWKSPATHRNVIAIVLAAFNYTEDMYEVANPIKGYKKPKAQPRLHSFSKEDEETIYANTDEAFKDFVFAAIHTGLRPFCELAQLTADNIVNTHQGMMWRVYATKTQKTRKIPVFPAVEALTRRLMVTAPKGSGLPLFRNSRDGAWRRGAGVARFLALKKKVGWDEDPEKKMYSCYIARHTFAHRMLSGYWNDGVGCSLETLAELLGDTPKVAYEHYGAEWSQSFQEPLWAAVGGGKKKKTN